MTAPAPDTDLYEQALDANRRLIARASEGIRAALQDEHTADEDTGPPLDPEPCP
jgi:hypothetical protein